MPKLNELWESCCKNPVETFEWKRFEHWRTMHLWICTVSVHWYIAQNFPSNLSCPSYMAFTSKRFLEVPTIESWPEWNLSHFKLQTVGNVLNFSWHKFKTNLVQLCLAVCFPGFCKLWMLLEIHLFCLFSTGWLHNAFLLLHSFYVCSAF